MPGMVSGTFRTILLLLTLLATTSTLRLLPLATEQTSISTVAGTGQRGYSGDGGPASRALINNPYMASQLDPMAPCTSATQTIMCSVDCLTTERLRPLLEMGSAAIPETARKPQKPH